MSEVEMLRQFRGDRAEDVSHVLSITLSSTLWNDTRSEGEKL